MDTSWIELSKGHPSYKEGVKKFILLAKENLINGNTRCPCKNCKVNKWLPIDEVEYHIKQFGFDRTYKNWVFHGKGDIHPRMVGNHLVNTSDQCANHLPREGQVCVDNTNELLNAAFEFSVRDLHASSEPDDRRDSPHIPDEIPTSWDDPYHFQNPTIDKEENAKYRKLLEASNEALYDGCTKFSKLTFMLRLFQMKCMFHWSAESFSMLLELLIDAFPQILDFPSSYYEGKKMIKDLGLGYEKIAACPNDCMLYWGEHAKKEECDVCHVSRWKTVNGNEGDRTQENQVTKKGEPAKVFRYFSLVKRLRRMYMSRDLAETMRWHQRDRVDDGILRHPADASAWKDFDNLYPDFAADPRSVRLALASDGFNPYRLMTTTYSTWPVVLIPYNLPPWLCMKPSSFILSMIIPGKSGPGKNLDVYLQPLLHELQLLWKGVDAFDAYDGKIFKLRAALQCTINDFPAYAMLSGWSTKGYNACPVCTNHTPSWNKEQFAGKICYIGHRKWLPVNHPYRSQPDFFDGTMEYGLAPSAATGSEILRQQEAISHMKSKTKKPKRSRKRKQGVEPSVDMSSCNCDGNAEENTVPWVKKSRFFDLPYWENNPLRHNLDVMHIEKNVCDNLLATLLDMDKSRDNENVRKALKDRGIKPHLWLRPHPSGNSLFMPPASFTMSIAEKDRFLRVLRKMRVPDGYGSNLSRCVNTKQRKLTNLKSHDNHILMQDVLPVALRASKATKIIDLLSELSSFFKILCSPTIDPNELEDLQSKIILLLCRMEIEFVPTFFTVMVHLLIHLVEEVRLGGPVHYRWMYPVERYLAHLKSFVSNKAYPEGSIVEAYLLEETIFFCSRFLESMELVFNRPKRNDGDASSMDIYLFNSGGRVIGKEVNICLDGNSLKQAHRYVLLHADEMKDLYEEFLRQKYEENRLQGIQASDENDWIINEYSDWLLSQVPYIDASTEKGKFQKTLAGGLNKFATEMKSFVVNGYKFQTLERERYRKTQNSGVMVEADGQVYYGRLTHIYELDYFGEFKVVMFRCNWVDIHRGVRIYDNGGAAVNFSKLMHTGRYLHDDPFVFSSQAKQVFYVEDETQKGWLHVIKTKPRDLFDLGDED